MQHPLRVITLGPHGAGKSTFGAALAGRLGICCLPELGRLHRERVLVDGRHALTRDPSFDRAVLADELVRDSELPARAVVETWHPGNLAYARARSPGVARQLGATVRAAATAMPGVVVVPLTAAAAVLAARCSEPGGTAAERLAFFAAVADDALALARRWGLRVLPTLDTGRLSTDACVDLVLEHIG